jgi:hypothetical protein
MKGAFDFSNQEAAMTFHHTRLSDYDRDFTLKSAKDARQGVTGHNVRFVLIASTTAVIIAFAMIYLATFV